MTGNTDEFVEVTNLGSLLFNYQHTIKELLGMRSCSGVTLQELERFKQEFRTAAFTCRLWSCPRAAMGFDDDDLRLAHEASHRRILCSVPDCQYPPFPSDRSLKEHHVKCHSGKVLELKRTTVKKVPVSIPSSMQKASEITVNMMAKQGMPIQTGQVPPEATLLQQAPLFQQPSYDLPGLNLPVDQEGIDLPQVPMNPDLRDYHMQLRLMDQQKKKQRRMQEIEEEDRIAYAATLSY